MIRCPRHPIGPGCVASNQLTVLPRQRARVQVCDLCEHHIQASGQTLIDDSDLGLQAVDRDYRPRSLVHSKAPSSGGSTSTS